MVYRIRYNDAGATFRQQEAIVEASSPTEALVKFCHTCPPRQDPSHVREQVTSICSEDEPILE